MALKTFLVLCLQVYLFQITFSQCTNGYGPSIGSPVPSQMMGPNPALGSLSPGSAYYNPGPTGQYYGYSSPASYSPPNSNYPGYGGSGSGDVAVAGELPVAGSTAVAGSVPVAGGVQFGGMLPAAGFVTITGTCSCGSPYGY